MPTRSQTRIRRDLNRLLSLIEKHRDAQPVLAALHAEVVGPTDLLNSSWKRFQEAVVAEDKERAERDTATERLRNWVQRWRPLVLLKVPGAAENLRALPARGATPDDQIRVASDLSNLIETNPACESFRSMALEGLGTGIEDAKQDLSEARASLVAEDGAREALSEATLSANTVLTRSLEIVRAVFGPRSPEARQFRLRASSENEDSTASEEAQEDQETELGES